MKTSLDWANQIAEDIDTIQQCQGVQQPHELSANIVTVVKAIQLEAVKEGMRRATEIMGEQPSMGDREFEEYKRLKVAILNASKQLTEKDNNETF